MIAIVSAPKDLSPSHMRGGIFLKQYQEFYNYFTCTNAFSEVGELKQLRIT